MSWYVWFILDILKRYVFDISVIYLRNAQDLHDLSLKISWDIPDTCLDIFEIYLRHARSMSLICVIYAWYIWVMFEIYPNYVSFRFDWYIPDICMRCGWDMSEMCLRSSRYAIQNLDKVSVSDWVTEWVCDVMKARDAYASKKCIEIWIFSPSKLI